MTYNWYNIDTNEVSTTLTENEDFIRRLDIFLADSDIQQDELGRYVINNEIRVRILEAANDEILGEMPDVVL